MNPATAARCAAALVVRSTLPSAVRAPRARRQKFASPPSIAIATTAASPDKTVRSGAGTSAVSSPSHQRRKPAMAPPTAAASAFMGAPIQR
jgi:hypothetical protein